MLLEDKIQSYFSADLTRREFIKLARNIGLTATAVISLGTTFGCSIPTKPNIPYQENISDHFSKLELWNPRLALEIRKLPEILDGIDVQDAKGINDLVSVYTKSPELKQKFDQAFEEMYKIGIPEVRKYCSPLQALYWLFFQGRHNLAEETIKTYDNREGLIKLLDKTWGGSNLEFSRFKYRQNGAEKLYNSTKDSKLIHMMDEFTKQNNGIMDLDKVIKLAEKHPDSFEYKYIDIFGDNYRKIFQERWSDFDTVVDRLNAPELIDHYIKKSIRYKTVGAEVYMPKTVFNRKWGDCDDLATFGNYILDRSGYKTFYITVGDDLNSHIGSGIKLDDGSYLVVVDFGTNGNLTGGPYKSRHEVRKQLRVRLR